MFWWIGLYILNLLAVLAVALQSARRPIWALTWVLICTVIPIVGPVLYLVFARTLRVRRQAPTRDGLAAAPHAGGTNFADVGRGSALATVAARSLASTLTWLSGNAPALATVQIFPNGCDTYAHLFRALRQAERTIDVEYYIYRDDTIGRQMAEILKQRAEAGVRVRFVVDGWGSRTLPRHILGAMQTAGIDCRVLFPVRLRRLGPTWNHRDHCKIVVIDDETGFVGGMNVGLEYTGLKADVGWWRDTHLRIAGPCVRQLQAVFEMNWSIGSPAVARRSAKARRTRQPAAHAAPTGSKRALSVAGGRTSPAWAGEWGPELAAPSAVVAQPMDGGQSVAESGRAPSDAPLRDSPRTFEAYCQTVESGPDRPDQTTRDLFFACLTQAQRTVDIATPYFVPASDLTLALKMAVARGLRVRLLVPAKPDHRLIGLASRTYYADLLSAGIPVFLYEKGLLHAKVMIVDGEVSIVGAANFDLRSFRLNYEVGEVLYGRAVADELTAQFEADLQVARRLRGAELQATPWGVRLMEQGARLLAPLL